MTATAAPAPPTAGPRTSRSLALIAAGGGAAAAAGPLLVCLAVGIVGWFVTDAGAHGTPTDAMAVGAVGWLTGHGSGLRVGGAQGVVVGIIPLGLTAVCAWVVWRVARRVGEAVSGHGPDADRLADGERDWTVPLATALFAAGYLVVAVGTATLVAAAGPSATRLVLGVLALTVVVGGPGVAVGSGRAAVWLALLPTGVVAACSVTRVVLRWWLGVGAVAFLVGLAVDLGTAATVFSRLHTDPGDTTLIVVLTLLVVPNVTLFAGSYLLGPGFAVGTGTLVTPTLVALGPLPMFPLLAALPEEGPAPAWTAGLMALPALTAAVGAARAQRRYPTRRWEEGALRACVGGVLAGVLFGVLADLAGGAVGPGRMQHVGPFVLDVVVHGVTAFGLGALVGGLVATWWQRRRSRPA